MQKRLFGKTGLELSILGFGCMRLPVINPSDPCTINYDLATTLVRKAIDQGVNYLDTAWNYHGKDRVHPGESEVFVGLALKDGYREKVNLATKLPTWVLESQKQMNDILDGQLKRLGTTHIDFYLAHNLNSLVWPKVRELGLLRFFDEALKDGRIKQAGFSFHDHYTLFEDILSSYQWSLAQIQYNYLDVDYQAGQRGVKLAHSRGVGLTVMEPLRGGFLINHMPDEMKSILANVRPEWSLADWGLRWVWHHPEVGVVLSGMNAMDQVTENLVIASSAKPLDEKEMAALAQVRELFRQRLKVNCTACGYCMPCSEGVNIPRNLGFYNDYYLVDADEVRLRTKYLFAGQVPSHETFRNCVHCCQCEEKCPQGIDISDRMEAMGEIFG